MNKILIFILLGMCFTLIIGCTKKDEPETQTSTVSDIDGNDYPTVKIGTQWWMAKNLKTTKYSNGEKINTTMVHASIENETSPNYQWAYLGNEGLASIYGRLYTWYAVKDTRNVCPTGWHIPNDSEWSTLESYLISNNYGYGGSGSDIGKSVAATSGWILYGVLGTVGNDQASNNSSGFSSLPGGIRQPDGLYLWAGADCYYWSLTESSSTMASWFLIDFRLSTVEAGQYNKNMGLSVKCIKNN